MMQDTAFIVWQNISGSGMLTALYVCAVVFLFFQEKETYKRILLVYLPVFWIGVLLLPVTYRVMAEVIDEEIYYRFFWMLPMKYLSSVIKKPEEVILFPKTVPSMRGSRRKEKCCGM